MKDSVNPRGNYGYRSPGNCYSLSINRITPKVFGPCIDGGDTPGSEKTWFGVPHIVSPHEVELTLSDFSSAVRTNRCISAWNKFHTQVPTVVSLPNFLIELKDFKGLAKGLAHAKSTVIESARKADKNLLKKPKSVASILNSTFLDINFNWMPFVSDLQKIMQIGESVTKRLTYLRQTKGRKVPIKYFASDVWKNPDVGTYHLVKSPFDTPFPGSTVYFGCCGGGGTSLQLKKYKANFVAHGSLFQDLRGLDDAWASWKVMWAQLGFNNPAKVIWNAIPFSFLLDWINPIGNWLDRFAGQPFEGDWQVYDVSHSVKETFTFEELITFNTMHYPGNPRLASSIEVTRYDRRVGLPLTFSDVDFDNITEQQQSLFLSLVAALTVFKK
jgi:hypothetical protein